jgi:hypothetical protein
VISICTESGEEPFSSGICIIDLTSTEEEHLYSSALQIGLTSEQLVLKFVRQSLAADSPIEEMQRRMREWQQETETELRPDISAHDLFARWAEEDSQMTEVEIAADEKLWQEYQQGIDEERAKSGMRLLFSS